MNGLERHQAEEIERINGIIDERLAEIRRELSLILDESSGYQYLKYWEDKITVLKLLKYHLPELEDYIKNYFSL